MALIRQALISVSDKTGIVELAKALQHFNVSILSTGGTAKLLAGAGIALTEVAAYTGFPEMLDGRVKTLHPKIHAGILARRDLPAHAHAMENAGLPYIDMVVVNLYPFSQTVARTGCTLEEAIENIDVGGPAMVRAAAKNYAHVAVVTDPLDYPAIIAELGSANGAIGLETRFNLSKKAFSHTAWYDGAVSNFLSAFDSGGARHRFPQRLNMQFEKLQDLRYGENPHQEAAFYRDVAHPRQGLSGYRQSQGKELSYNNIADADAAWECVKTFDRPACVIVKHANPCGAAVAENLLLAYQLAFATDPISAFGGVIAFNRDLDGATAAAMMRQFVEVVIAPKISPEAAQLLAGKHNVRALEVAAAGGANDFDFKRVGGGLLVQTPDAFNLAPSQFHVVTKAQPTREQVDDMLFAWQVAKFVKSNAIVFAKSGQTLGVGAGQMSRVDSARIASIKAGNAGLNLAGSVVASDAFFPFRDGLDMVAAAGAKAVVQPGGSVQDNEVIAAADEHGIAMAFTGVRHFRH